jgi:uncharacterized lipoprotein NlpE involved in copper resistance
MRERIYNGLLIFDIDANGDNYTSFETAVEKIRELSVFNEQKYYSGFFDDALLWGECDGIDIKLEFSGFMGTELKVSEKLIESDLSKVRHWAEEIYKAVQNNESPT